jgi:Leucine-rich repeat (LRR) protein/cold shock CspA family protein
MANLEIYSNQNRFDDYLNRLPANYRDANLVFAYYATFPTVFSPDLLFQFWFFLQDFKKNEVIEKLPMVVVSDLLQSGICHEIAYELYEFDEHIAAHIKATFAERCKAKQISLIYQLSDFASLTLEYAERYYKNSNRKNLYDMYYWKSMFIINPVEATKEIKAILNKEKSQNVINQSAGIYLQLAEYQVNELNKDSPDISKLPTFSYEKDSESIDINDVMLRREIAEIIDLKHNMQKSNKFLTKIPHYDIATQDRIEDVEQIKSLLKTNNKIFIKGQQGAGKTSFLIQFIKRYEADYEYIIFLHGNGIGNIQTFASIMQNLNIDAEINFYKERLAFIYEVLGSKKTLIILDGINKRTLKNFLTYSTPSNIDCLITGQTIPKIFSESFLEYSIDYNDKFKPELIKYLEHDLGIIAKQVKTTKELDDNLLKDDFLYYVNEKGEITHMLLCNLSYPNIRHLTFFTDLVKLEINKSTGLDLEYINNLNDLEELCLCENDITDIYFVRKLTKLKELCLCNNNIYDINDLKNLIQLEDLKIFANQISDISPLRNLSNLRILDISGNNISDMEMLKKLYNLEDLDIAVNEITDVSFIQNLIKLKKLDLSGNEISDISAISSLYNLEQLDLRHCAISELPEEILSYFSNQKNLKELVLNGNYIRGVPHGILEAENALESLRLFLRKFNAISNLETQLNFELKETKDESKIISHNLRESGFYICNESAQVTHLNLLGFELRDLTFLEDFKDLEVLNLNRNELSDIELLSNLQFLKKLDLGCNGIVDISPLSSLSRLEELYLGLNNIKNLFPIQNIGTLKILELQHNEIEEIYYFLGSEPKIFSCFHYLSELTALNLSFNPVNKFNEFVFNQDNCIKDFEYYQKSPDWYIDFLLYHLNVNYGTVIHFLDTFFYKKNSEYDKLRKSVKSKLKENTLELGRFILKNREKIINFIFSDVKQNYEYQNSIQIEFRADFQFQSKNPVFAGSKINEGRTVNEYLLGIRYKTKILELHFHEYPIGISETLRFFPKNLRYIIENTDKNLLEQFQDFLDDQYKDVILDDYQEYLDLFCKSPTEDIKVRTIKRLEENQFLNDAIQQALYKELQPIIIQDFIFEETLEVLGIKDIDFDSKSQTIVVSGHNNAVLQVNMDFTDMDNVRIYTLPFSFNARLKKEKKWSIDSCTFEIDRTSYNIGTIAKSIDEKGFGFIKPIIEDGENIFYHVKQCVDLNYFPKLGDLVVYESVPGRITDRRQANNIVLINSLNIPLERSIEFSTPQEALEYFKENPATPKRDEIISFEIKSELDRFIKKSAYKELFSYFKQNKDSFYGYEKYEKVLTLSSPLILTDDVRINIKLLHAFIENRLNLSSKLERKVYELLENNQIDLALEALIAECPQNHLIEEHKQLVNEWTNVKENFSNHVLFDEKKDFIIFSILDFANAINLFVIPPLRGIVNDFIEEKGYGFIISQNRENIRFFHIKRCVDYKYIPQNDDVVAYEFVEERESSDGVITKVVFLFNKDTLKQLIAQNKIEEASSMLFEFLPKQKQKALKILEKQWISIERGFRLGILSHKEYSIERNKIVPNLIDLVNCL